MSHSKYPMQTSRQPNRRDTVEDQLSSSQMSQVPIWPATNRQQNFHSQPMTTHSSFSSTISSLMSNMSAAVQVSVSSSSVVYDGQNTYVESQEQNFSDGQWTQQKVEGVWAGDQSQQAIQSLSTHRTPLGSRLQKRPSATPRPLPRSQKTK